MHACLPWTSGDGRLTVYGRKNRNVTTTPTERCFEEMLTSTPSRHRVIVSRCFSADRNQNVHAQYFFCKVNNLFVNYTQVDQIRSISNMHSKQEYIYRFCVNKLGEITFSTS